MASIKETWDIYFAFNEGLTGGYASEHCQGESDGIRKLAVIEEKAGKSVTWAVIIKKVDTLEITEYTLSGEPPELFVTS